MCTEMTKTSDIMMDLRQRLYMCKAETTQFNDRVAIGGFCAHWTAAHKDTNKPWNIMQRTYKNKR